jgi:hypothetical protein
MFIWGMVRLVVTIIMRAFAIYRWRGAGLWILGAFWSLPFQLIITPFPWAGGTAVDVANWVRTEMVCQARHEEARRGNGGSQTGAVEETQRSESAYPPFIPSFVQRADWKRQPRRGVSDKDLC